MHKHVSTGSPDSLEFESNDLSHEEECEDEDHVHPLPFEKRENNLETNLPFLKKLTLSSHILDKK